MAKLRRRGRNWQLCWSESGKEYRKSLGAITADKAKHIAKLKGDELTRRRLEGGGLIQFPTGAGPLFRDFADSYLDWHEHEYPDSHDRIRGLVELHLKPAFGLQPLGALEILVLEGYRKRRMATGAAAGTVAKEMRACQAILNRAVTLKVIPSNPAKGATPPTDLSSKPPRFYLPAELKLLYKQSRSLTHEKQPETAALKDYAPLWQLLANTGLRRGEVQQLRWADVDRTEIRVLSEKGARTKSGKWRMIPLSKGALGALRRLRMVTGNTMYVVPAIHPISLTRAFERCAKRAKLDGNLHCLRHTFAAHLVMGKVPLRTVQVLMGHASFATTEKYAHLSPGYLQSAVAGLNL